MQNPRLVKLASSEEREKWENIWILFRYLGKHRKLRKSPKNKIAWKPSQKFSKIINIIKRFLVKSIFRNSILFSK